ncbi:MAG: hypothetical protein GXY55_16260 [Phycisphaerae bacterium]|nr:hypothetical protein [Phycisphaerae bacterium]
MHNVAHQLDTEQYLTAKIEAQRSSTLIQVAALIGAALCIALAARLQTPINNYRKELQLVTHSNIYRALPPKYALATAIGGPFRGPAILFLWLRHEKLKEEGKYYESHQLAKWICTLQPRFPAVWSFQSWNMAYNISVATHTAPERWQWVYNGIRLLRDEGIPNNPRITPLYHQLAWTWFHKVGDRSDDFHWMYKRYWAAAMETLLGSPPAGLSNSETIDWFRPIAEAPATLAELIEKRPGVGQLVSDLNAQGLNVEATTRSQRVFHPIEESFFRSYTAFGRERELAVLRTDASQTGITTNNNEWSRLWPVFEAAPREDLDALLAFLRAKVLREQYKMDPAYMLELTTQLGTEEPIPIDWRTPWSQSMYWAKYGVQKSSELTKAKEFDIVNTDRILLFSLATLARQGRYTFRLNMDDPVDSFLWPTPDFRYVEAMHRKYLELGPKHAEEGEEVGDTAGEMLRSGHVNNLHAAVVSLYLAGRQDEARKYFDYLAVNYKDPDTKATKRMYLQGLDDFVRGELKEMIGSYQEAVYAINSLLTSGYMSLASGWADEFAGAVQNASMLYREYQKEHRDDRQGRLTLPEFADLRAQTLRWFVLDPQYPLLYRSMVWNREQADILRRAYDFVAGPLAQQCAALDLDVARAFPEPPGMEQYRKERPKPAQPEDVSEEYRREQIEKDRNR